MIQDSAAVKALDGSRLAASKAETATNNHDPVAACILTIAAGDGSAFGALYKDVAPMVKEIARRVTGNQAIAEEVTQEVLVELWRSAGRFDTNRGSARGWIAAIARRRAIDRVRSEESHRRRHQSEFTDISATDTASANLEAVEERHQVRAALGALTEPQRQAITMAFFNDFTYREVAAVLGVPEGTIKTRIRDGLCHLRNSLAS